MLAGTPSGPFWIPASTRVYCAGGAFFDHKVGTHFNLVPRNEVVVPSEASGDVGTTTRSGSAQSGTANSIAVKTAWQRRKEGSDWMELVLELLVANNRIFFVSSFVEIFK